jgi:1,4-alpha-glucan branching enzyme
LDGNIFPFLTFRFDGIRLDGNIFPFLTFRFDGIRFDGRTPILLLTEAPDMLLILKYNSITLIKQGRMTQLEAAAQLS